ncbi:MAG: extracellular solute-binding protein [Bacilli bacterium]|nr:extracellular solute-binding protein [Bacilli bacterium]
MKNSKFVALGALALLTLPALTGCASNNNVRTLRILNCEDYIADDIVENFTKDWNESHPGEKISVVYDTFDTNETMLSSLKTGKSSYDLICPSDYAIQKMMRDGMLQPFDDIPDDNYNTYASKYLVSRLDSIESEIGDGTGVKHKVSEYARGYMWGTLGVVYNPAKIADITGLEEDEIKVDMNSWTSLWDAKYHNIMSIKDSMRDTYSVGIMKAYNDEIIADMDASGVFDENYNLLDTVEFDSEEALAYNEKLTKIFNRCGYEETKVVEKELLSLKANVFGFEVDSGKDDMVKGIVGMNLAWSGDAVYSLDRGENENDTYLYYSIPETGGNIWFDGWVMPKGADKELAQDFIDYISSPEIAAENMDFIGYTSFIAGDTVLDLVRQWYDPRSYAMYVWHDASKDSGCTWEDSDFVYDEDDELVYQDGTGLHEDTGDDYGPFDMTGSTYEEAVVDGVAMSWEDYQAMVDTYNEAEFGDDEDSYLSSGWDTVNLTYIFSGTIDDYDESTFGDTPDDNPYLFYTDALETITTEDGREVVAGRQFFTQYAPQEMLPKLAIMADYGENNVYVLNLWENVKANNLPIWGVIIFGIILLSAIVVTLSTIIIRRKQKKLRVERRKITAANMRK